MRPTQHPSNNRVLGAPKGWDQDELPCGAIAVTDTSVDGVRCVSTFWRPDADELARLNAGECVMLTFVGQTLPPVAVGVEW